MPWNPEQSSFAMPASPFLATGQKFFEAGIRLQAHGFKAIMQYQIEALSFIKRRCENDVKLMEDLAGSEESKDAFDVVANFTQNAISDYAAEAGRVASIGAKLASETAKRVQKEAKITIEDMAVATTAA
jgi:hypothetical protein